MYSSQSSPFFEPGRIFYHGDTEAQSRRENKGKMQNGHGWTRIYSDLAAEGSGNPDLKTTKNTKDTRRGG